MQIKFIYYPKCSTCINAKKHLEALGFKLELIDIKNDNPNFQEIESYYKKSGLNINKLFNTSGILYRELNLKEKLKTLSEKEKLELLASNGMLIKRPIIITEDKAYFGFKKQLWEK